MIIQMRDGLTMEYSLKHKWIKLGKTAFWPFPAAVSGLLRRTRIHLKPSVKMVNC